MNCLPRILLVSLTLSTATPSFSYDNKTIACVGAAAVAVGGISYAVYKKCTSLSQAELDDLNDQLLLAISDEDLPAVRKLLKQGADANYCNKWGNTPLMYAIETEDVADIVEELLKHGANPNLDNGYYDETPLISAVRENDVAVVKLLLQYGAHPNAQDDFGKTALDYAKNYPRIAELLKAHGATE